MREFVPQRASIVKRDTKTCGDMREISFASRTAIDRSRELIKRVDEILKRSKPWDRPPGPRG
jgi:hypothetical protein